MYTSGRICTVKLDALADSESALPRVVVKHARTLHDTEWAIENSRIKSIFGRYENIESHILNEFKDFIDKEKWRPMRKDLFYLVNIEYRWF